MSRPDAQTLVRLLRLRELRLHTAERALAEARAKLDQSAEALAACEAAVAAVIADQANLERWFQDAPDPRHLPSALHRREALAARRTEFDADREAAADALAEAQEAHAAGLAYMNRARARRDVAALRVADDRRARDRRDERAAEEEGDERAAARSWRGLAPQGVPA